MQGDQTQKQNKKRHDKLVPSPSTSTCFPDSKNDTWRTERTSVLRRMSDAQRCIARAACFLRSSTIRLSLFDMELRRNTCRFVRDGLSQSRPRGSDRIGSKSGTKLFYTSCLLYLSKEKSELTHLNLLSIPHKGKKCSARMVLTSGHGIAIVSLLYTESSSR